MKSKINHGSYYLYPQKIPYVRTFVLTFNAFGRWAPEAPIDQTLRFRLVRASGFPSPKKKSASGFPSPKKKSAIFHTLLDKYFTSFSFVLTFNAFGRWAPEAPIDQTLRFRLVRASGFPSPPKKSASGFPSPKKNQVFLAFWSFSKFLFFWMVFGRLSTFSHAFACFQTFLSVLRTLTRCYHPY